MSLLDTASLVITPNGYKEGTLYSVIPNTTLGDMIVVRATTATRVNSAGLIELVPYNLFTYSEQFNNADWGKTGATFSGDTLTGSAGTSLKGIYQGETTNGVQSAYFDVEFVNHTWVQILIGTQGSDIGYVNYNIQNKVVGDQSGGYTGTIQDFGTFVRIKFNCNTLNKVAVFLILVNSGTAPRADSTSSTGSIKLYRSQLVEGSVAKDYLRTETRLNIPRLDYSNGTCPSLLVEPQRTNLVLYSEQFDNAAWAKLNVTVTVNNAISPDGTQNADKIDYTNVNNYLVSTSTNAQNISYTASCYVKKGTTDRFVLREGFYFGSLAEFNLTNGTIVSDSTGTAKITSVGNGWYRCSITQAYVSVQIYVIFSYDSYLGTGTLFLYGAQVEAGSYPTSYIPTTSAAVTRNADVISKTGISSLIGQTQGTIFIDFNIDNILSQTVDPIIFSTSGQIYIRLFTTGAIYYTESSALGLISPVGTINNGKNKIAVNYKNNDFSIYANGVLVATNNSGTVTAKSQISLNYIGDLQYNPSIFYNLVTLFPNKLTGAECISLTTL